MKICIINGPNLNLVGVREPDIYGIDSFESFIVSLRAEFPCDELEYYQSNVEGEIINKLHEVGFSADGIILNAGGYTHTSIAIGDAVKAIKTPVIEVHLSNIFSREEFRHKSFIAPHAKGMICGLGIEGYRLAVEWMAGQSQRSKVKGQKSRVKSQESKVKSQKSKVISLRLCGKKKSNISPLTFDF